MPYQDSAIPDWAMPLYFIINVIIANNIAAIPYVIAINENFWNGFLLYPLSVYLFHLSFSGHVREQQGLTKQFFLHGSFLKRL